MYATFAIAGTSVSPGHITSFFLFGPVAQEIPFARVFYFSSCSHFSLNGVGPLLKF